MRIQLLDDDMKSHFPWHFHGYLRSEDVVFGQCSDKSWLSRQRFTCKVISHTASNRLIHYLKTFRFLLRSAINREKITDVIVYDDLLKLLLCILVFQNRKIVFRLTHLKWREKFKNQVPLMMLYENILFFLIRYMTIRVVFMSEKMREKFGHYARATCIVIESSVPRKVCRYRQRESVILYSGTLSKHRNLSQFLTKLADECDEKNIKLVILGVSSAPGIQYFKSLLHKHKSVVLYFNLDEPEYDEILSHYTGIAIAPYFYDTNPVLKYNSPLKTVDLLNRGFVVVGSDIKSHCELAKNLSVDQIEIVDNKNMLDVVVSKYKNYMSGRMHNKVDIQTIRGEEYCRNKWNRILGNE